MKLNDEKLLYICVYFYVFITVINSANGDIGDNLEFFKPVNMALVIIISLTMVNYRLPIRIEVIVVSIGGVILLNSIISHSLILLVNFALVIALTNKKYAIDNVCKSILIALISSISIVLLLHFYGFIPDALQFQHERWRHSLGFKLPVTLPNYYVAIVAIFTFIYRNRFKLSQGLLLTTPALLIFNFTDGRSSCYIAVLIVIGAYLITLLKSKKLLISKLLYITSIASYIFGCISSIWIATHYETSSWLQLHDIDVTGRFKWFSLSWANYPLNLFGNNIADDVDDGNVILDNLYLTLLLRCGVLVFIIFSVILFKLMQYYYRRKDNVLLLILSLIFVNSVVSASWMPFWKNILLLPLATVLQDYIESVYKI